MTAIRLISLPVHGLLELVAGLALVTAPFALGFGPAGMVLALAFGVLMVGLALGADGDMPVSSHLAFDHALVMGMAAGALALAVAGDDPATLALAAATGVEFALTVTTRYSRLDR